MIKKRPLGISLMGGAITVVGGFATLVLFLEILDAARIGGPAAIGVATPTSLAGFVLYGCTPLICYACGIGLFNARPWAYRSLLWLIPLLCWLLMMHTTAKVLVHLFYPVGARLFDLVLQHAADFLKVSGVFFLFYLPLILYLQHPHIREYFQE